MEIVSYEYAERWCTLISVKIRSEQTGQREALGQYASLAHLDLCGNGIVNSGTERLAGVLGQCAVLAHLDLCNNDICNHDIGAAGAESFAGVLAQC